MPTKTIKPRGSKIKQSVRHGVKQKVVVNVIVGRGGKRVSSQRPQSAMLLKTLMTRPTPQQVITIPQMGAAPSVEQMRDMARQEIMIKDMIEKQAVIMSRMNQQGFYRDPEGILVPQVGADEKAKYEEELRASRAELQRLYDERMKESPFAVTAPAPTPAPTPPPPPPPPPKFEVPEATAPLTGEKPPAVAEPIKVVPAYPVEKAPVMEEEIKTPVKKVPSEGESFKEELEREVGKSPSEIVIEKAMMAISRRSVKAQIDQLNRSGVRPNTIEAYRRYYDLDPSTSVKDIIAYIEQTRKKRD